MKKIVVLLTLIAVMFAYSCSNSGSYKEGDKVKVMWNEKLFDATIVKVGENNKYTIHYEGWADTWDEEVGLDRINPKE